MGFLRKITPKRVKTKTLVALGVIIGLMTTVPVILMYRSTINRVYMDSRVELKQHAIMVKRQLLENSASQLRLLAHTVADIPSVQQYFGERDRTALLGVTMPIYHDLKNIIDLNVFHFHLPPATSFLRLQKPEKYGDDLSGFRHTVVSVNHTHQDAFGIEVGRAGISVRAVVPVTYKGRPVGSVEFGAPVNDALLAKIKENVGVDIAVVIPDGDAFRFQAKTHNLRIPERRYPFLRKMMQSKELVIERVSKDGKELITAFQPIPDYTGKVVGVLAIPKNITNSLANAKKSALTIVGAGAL
ncbi:MAG TPA: hypothetical protein ENK84_04375, partial [Desulfobulbus sp.]|nr:hypothetical protein [Desulfobulbus sp.]